MEFLQFHCAYAKKPDIFHYLNFGGLMKKFTLLTILLAANSLYAGQSFNCKDSKGKEVKLKQTSETSFELSSEFTTTIFVQTDELIDFAINDVEIIYKSESERWVENPWFGFKMYTHYKTNFEYNKITKLGLYERYSKVGLLSRADKDKIAFKCK